MANVNLSKIGAIREVEKVKNSGKFNSDEEMIEQISRKYQDSRYLIGEVKRVITKLGSQISETTSIKLLAGLESYLYELSKRHSIQLAKINAGLEMSAETPAWDISEKEKKSLKVAETTIKNAVKVAKTNRKMVENTKVRGRKLKDEIEQCHSKAGNIISYIQEDGLSIEEAISKLVGYKVSLHQDTNDF